MINSIKSASFGGGGGVSVGSGGGISVGADFNGGSGAAGQEGMQTDKPAARELRVTFEGDNPHSEAMRTFVKNLEETMADMGSDTKLVLTS